MHIDKPEDMALLLRRQGPPQAREQLVTILAGLQLRPDASCLLLGEQALWDSAAQALGAQGQLLPPAPAAGTQLLLLASAWIPAGLEASRTPVEIRVLQPGGAPEHASGEACTGTGPRQAACGTRSRLLMHKCLALREPLLASAGPPWPIPELGPLQPGPPSGRSGRAEALSRAAAWLSAWPHGCDAQAAAAPPDQWIPQGLRGDESLELIHLHPRHPSLCVRLPGLRPTCRWSLLPDSGHAPPHEPIDLPLRARTLWLFPERLRGILVYEARIATPALREGQQEALRARWQPDPQGAKDLGAADSGPRPAPAAFRFAAAAPAPSSADAPAAPAAPAGDRAAASTPRPGAAAEARDLRREMAAGARALLREQGWNQARLDELDARGWLADPGPEQDSLEDLLHQLQQQTDALRRRHGLDEAALARFTAEPDQDPGTPPDPASFPAELAQALEALESATRKALAEAGLDEEQALHLLHRHQPDAAHALDGLLRAGTTARGAQDLPQDAPREPRSPPRANTPEQPAPRAGAAPPPPPAGTRPLSREQVQRALREGESLQGAILDGLDLRGLDFSGADLREVRARGTLLAACTMREADLREALLHDADLRAADLQAARLAGCSCARASMEQVCLDRADCSDTDFTRARLDGASLREACLRRCVFEHARMRAVLAAGCDASSAQFGDCALDESDWRRATLRAAAWLDCGLRRVRADQADARGLALYGSQAREAVFEQADLRGSRAGDGSRFVGALLAGADMREACWEGCWLAAADLRGCRLDDADLSRVRARGARMDGMHASRLRLDEADLRRADLRGTKLVQASLAGADLRGARLAGALCFGSDLADVRAQASTWQGADLRRTVVAARAAPEEKGDAAEPRP